jgi:hypothetical protein
VRCHCTHRHKHLASLYRVGRNVVLLCQFSLGVDLDSRVAIHFRGGFLHVSCCLCFLSCLKNEFNTSGLRTLHGLTRTIVAYRNQRFSLRLTSLPYSRGTR